MLTLMKKSYEERTIQSSGTPKGWAILWSIQCTSYDESIKCAPTSDFRESWYDMSRGEMKTILSYKLISL